MSQAREETLVAMPAEGGFRVYAPSDPARTYLVSGTAAVPDCTCPEFREEAGEDPDFRCRHILAVESQLPQPTPLDDEEREERRAIQAEGAAPQTVLTAVANSGAQMTIKRSASPDGRIDSLSIEFTCPVEGLTQGAIKARAAKTLNVQDDIIAGFLERHYEGTEAGGDEERETGNSSGHSDRRNGGNGRSRNRNERDHANDDDGTLNARMLDVRGMQTRYGWRMFINVRAGNKTYKLFGDRRALGDFVTDVGYPDLSRNLNSGTELNIPCRVTLKQSEDGRYQNVDEVFPAENDSRERSHR